MSQLRNLSFSRAESTVLVCHLRKLHKKFHSTPSFAKMPFDIQRVVLYWAIYRVLLFERGWCSAEWLGFPVSTLSLKMGIWSTSESEWQREIFLLDVVLFLVCFIQVFFSFFSFLIYLFDVFFIFTRWTVSSNDASTFRCFLRWFVVVIHLEKNTIISDHINRGDWIRGPWNQ